MQPFLAHTGVAAALLRPNIDTDAIIPSREMKSVSKRGLADGLFANWRYRDAQQRLEDPDFVLNRPRHRGASILLAGPNFGCGSSREHAVWALGEYGVRCIIAPSFGSIFQGNCVRNGLLPAVLAAEEVEDLATWLEDAQAPQLHVDLQSCQITAPSRPALPFHVSAGDRETLLEGLDAIGATLKQEGRINAFESAHRAARPWLFRSGPVS